MSTPSPFSVVLNSTSQQACATVPIINDLEIEEDEQFIVTATIDLILGTFELVRAQTLVTILDDRKPTHLYFVYILYID